MRKFNSCTSPVGKITAIKPPTKPIKSKPEPIHALPIGDRAKQSKESERRPMPHTMNTVVITQP